MLVPGLVFQTPFVSCIWNYNSFLPIDVSRLDQLSSVFQHAYFFVETILCAFKVLERSGCSGVLITQQWWKQTSTLCGGFHPSQLPVDVEAKSAGKAAVLSGFADPKYYSLYSRNANPNKVEETRLLSLTFCPLPQAEPLLLPWLAAVLMPFLRAECWNRIRQCVLSRSGEHMMKRIVFSTFGTWGVLWVLLSNPRGFLYSLRGWSG